MIFQELSLKGAYLIKPEVHSDERGFFARSFCKQEFQAQGLVTDYVQNNISYNKKKGTLRGMHYQLSPHQETKLVRCSRGAIYDVIVDIRQNSTSYRQWQGIELTQDNCHLLYVPEGFAHGFLTLEDHSEVFYQMSALYQSDFSRTMSWNMSKVNIKWPLQPTIISEKDACAMDNPVEE